MVVRELIKASVATVCAAPLFGVIWELGFGLYEGSLMQIKSATAFLVIGLMLGTATLLYIVPALLLLGIPAFLALREIDRASIWTCLGAALIPGAVIAVVSGEVRAGLLTLPFAFGSALVFWLFARKVARKPRNVA